MKTLKEIKDNIKRACVSCQRGFTLLEVLLAGFLTAVIATAAFSFVTRVHDQAEAQTDFTQIHDLCRASLDDMKRTMREAGYKLNGHKGYEVKGDTLAIYFSDTQPIDTVLYFLREFTDQQYTPVSDRPTGLKLYQLMRQKDSEIPAIFSDYITGMRVTPVDSANVLIQIGALAARRDLDYGQNNGYRTYSLVERVHLRNMSL